MNDLNELSRERLEAEADARRLRLVKTLEALAPSLELQPEVAAASVAAAVAATPVPVPVVEDPRVVVEAATGTAIDPPKKEEAQDKASEPSEPQLEAEAEASRKRLIHIFSTLRHRFHQTLTLKGQATQHPLSVAVVGAGSLFVLAEGARMALSHLQHKQEAPTLNQRLRAVAKVWKEPERIARPPRFQMAKGVALGVVSAAASVAAIQITNRILKRIFPEPH